MKTLKERLIFARELRQLTQADLAKKSKCGQSAIGNVESGTRNTLRNLVLVARALRVSADWLFDGKGPTPTANDDQVNWTPSANRPFPALIAKAADSFTIGAHPTEYDIYTTEVIRLMNSLTADQKAAALARLKEFVGHLAPPDHGQALSMAG